MINIKNHVNFNFFQWLINYKYSVFIITAFVCFGLASGQSKIGFNTDYRYFFGEETKQTKAMEELDNIYSKNDNIYISITPNDQGSIFRPEILRAILETTEKAWTLPFSTRVDSLSNFQHTSAKNEELIVEDLISYHDLENSKKIESIKDIAVNNVLLANRLISPNGLHTGINVTLFMPGESMFEVPQAVIEARKLKKDIESKYPVTIRLSGITFLNNAFGEVGASDHANLTPIMYGIMLIILLVLFRSVLCLIAALAVVFLSTSATMGIVGYSGILLTPPSSIAATAILTMAVADSVHILMGMNQYMQAGNDKYTSIKLSLLKNIKPIFFSSLTTIIGFLSLNFCDAPPYHDLGNITAIGVAIAFLLSITFLPALLAILPFKAKSRTSIPAKSQLFLALERFLNQWYYAVFIAFIGFTSAALWVIPSLSLDDRFVEYFSEEIEFRRDSDYISNNLTGLYSIDFNVNSAGPNGISDPTFMNKVDEFSKFYREQSNVYNVNVYTDTVKRINRSLHNDNDEYYRLPSTKEEAAQYILLYEMSLPFGLDLTNQISLDKSSTKISIIMKDVSTAELRNAAKLGEEWLTQNAPEYMKSTGSGATVVFAHVSKANIEGMISGTALSFILITLLMILSLASFRYGLVSIFANVSPAIIAIGIWTVIHGKAGMEISIVISATLGIIVDDCVHFLIAYVKHKKQGHTVSEAISQSFSDVGNALIYTSTILIGGFIVLTMSDFSINSALGMMSALTILFGLLINLLFMPSILLMIDKIFQKKTTNNRKALA